MHNLSKPEYQNKNTPIIFFQNKHQDVFQTKACFVCGKTEPGKRVSMSNFKLRYSQSEILEKLGNVVGDNLLVVCCKGDVICQHCVSVMEVIDKLEYELSSSKRIILRLLENKYNLKSKYESAEDDPDEPEAVAEVTESIFAMRKRKSQESVEELTNSVEEDPRQRVWLECDKCHYTTNYTTFIDRHIRPTPCLNCGTLMRDGLCPVCSGEQENVLKAERSPSEEPCPPMSPSNFLEDETVLAAIEGETLDTSQINLTDADVEEDPDDKQLTYLEFVDEDGNEEKAEEFHVSGDLETGDIWEEET